MAEGEVTARKAIERAGWFPGRKVDVSSALAALELAGFNFGSAAEAILSEYSSLEFRDPASPGQRLWIDGARAAQECDPDWCSAYEAGSDQVLTPIGGFSHATIYIDDGGRFWGGFDLEYGLLGDSLDELVHALVVLPGSRPFDHQLPH